jgi:hypothetical protein
MPKKSAGLHNPCLGRLHPSEPFSNATSAYDFFPADALPDPSSAKPVFFGFTENTRLNKWS